MNRNSWSVFQWLLWKHFREMRAVALAVLLAIIAGQWGLNLVVDREEYKDACVLLLILGELGAFCFALASCTLIFTEERQRGTDVRLLAMGIRPQTMLLAAIVSGVGGWLALLFATSVNVVLIQMFEAKPIPDVWGLCVGDGAILLSVFGAFLIGGLLGRRLASAITIGVLLAALLLLAIEIVGVPLFRAHVSNDDHVLVTTLFVGFLAVELPICCWLMRRWSHQPFAVVGKRIRGQSANLYSRLTQVVASCNLPRGLRQMLALWIKELRRAGIPALLFAGLFVLAAANATNSPAPPLVVVAAVAAMWQSFQPAPPGDSAFVAFFAPTQPINSPLRDFAESDWKNALVEVDLARRNLIHDTLSDYSVEVHPMFGATKQFIFQEDSSGRSVGALDKWLSGVEDLKRIAGKVHVAVENVASAQDASATEKTIEFIAHVNRRGDDGRFARKDKVSAKGAIKKRGDVALVLSVRLASLLIKNMQPTPNLEQKRKIWSAFSGELSRRLEDLVANPPTNAPQRKAAEEEINEGSDCAAEECVLVDATALEDLIQPKTMDSLANDAAQRLVKAATGEDL